ncbi:MAG TPA: hypothetical protein V6C71_18975 [Coleofasciculaceae cyanobacterium]|jgi:hypothetical protein
MFKQYISLMIAPVIVGLYVGLANAQEVEVKAGNMQVSVENGNVEVSSDSHATKTRSLLDRLSHLRLFGDRQAGREATPLGYPTGHRSNSATYQKCDRAISGYSTTRSNSSGTAVSQSRSSSTTMTCN